jgi:hypothetical protein
MVVLTASNGLDVCITSQPAVPFQLQALLMTRSLRSHTNLSLRRVCIRTRSTLISPPPHRHNSTTQSSTPHRLHDRVHPAIIARKRHTPRSTPQLRNRRSQRWSYPDRTCRRDPTRSTVASPRHLPSHTPRTCRQTQHPYPDYRLPHRNLSRVSWGRSGPPKSL